MKKFIFVLTVLLTLSFNCQRTYSQWVQKYASDELKSIAVDFMGNVYVAGFEFDGEDSYLTTIKYNSFGIQQWIQKYNGPDHSMERAYCIVVDGVGNVYVTGCSGPWANIDIVTIKYDSNGDSLWVRRYNGSGNGEDIGASLAVDTFGNVHVTGSASITGSSRDYVTLKYNSSGDLLWEREFNGSANANDGAVALSIDSSGNVYITGTSQSLGTNADYVTIKYNSSGDQQWYRQYNGKNHYPDQAFAITVDESGNVYVTGESDGGYNMYDYATIKYNSNGDSLWVRRYNGPGNNFDMARGIAVSVSGNVYVTGKRTNVNLGTDFATIKYNSTGVQKWVALYDDGSFDGAMSVGLDGSENIYVTGSSGRSGYIHYNIATVKYDSGGNKQWVQKYDDPNHSSYPQSMIVDNIGNVYIVGNNYPFKQSLTIKYSQLPHVSLDLSALIEGFYDNNTDRMNGDTLKVVIRNSYSPYSIVDSAKSILDSTGHGVFAFPLTMNGIGYYLILKHRNSIETWSKQAISFSNNQLSYDFTTTANMAYGNNLVLKETEYCIYSGDINQDGLIDLSDSYQIYNDAANVVTGYVKTDVTGDALVDLSDLTLAINNANLFVKVLKP